MPKQKDLTNGPAVAAILASGIGSLALGLFTTLAEAITFVKNTLIFYKPAGPLSGKTTIAVAVWLVTWIVLHSLWKNKQFNFAKVFSASLILIALGLIGTFPPFYELFGK